MSSKTRSRVTQVEQSAPAVTVLAQAVGAAVQAVALQEGELMEQVTEHWSPWRRPRDARQTRIRRRVRPRDWTREVEEWSRDGWLHRVT